ncbi:EamA family transporter [Oceanirhabdus sp. W0125-5]|uniref:EamA family transporter n=1 Tax=Oceanirhabdus sp. W0125-5 TaxID=2999116 RepID=UPI0022F336AE|nr:EamA family transporter [Oceanirhabdus sp. W0125-5]WBW96722.1 EamA family transporter [Oceanirhabdus sp. W0125-5]
MLVIICSAMYHIGQKFINENINPMVSMTATYLVALIVSIGSIFLFPSKNIVGAFKELSWPSYILGIAVFGIETGFLLAYRNGWNINVAPLFSTTISTLVLVGIGIYIFKEHLSVVNIIGICLCIVGLILMKK